MVAAAIVATGCSAPKAVIAAHASAPDNAAGVALLGRGLDDAARAAFERALAGALRMNDASAEIEARLNLVSMDLDAGQPAAATSSLLLVFDRMRAWRDVRDDDRAVSLLTAAELTAAVNATSSSEMLTSTVDRFGRDAALLVALGACARGDDAGERAVEACRRYEVSERDALQVRVLRCEAQTALARGDAERAIHFVDRAVEVDRLGHDVRALRDDLAVGARVLERANAKENALVRWLDVARVDAALGRFDGLEEVSGAVERLAPEVSAEDRALATRLVADLRARLGQRPQRETTK
jgi:hypothetical protein